MSDVKDPNEEVSSRELPLSTVDNTPPLLLDLPDGQQLVVGKLPEGIVIEIATWRGTGRPDSRTNRMMLGVSYDEKEVEVEEKPQRSILKRIRREEGQAEGPRSDVTPAVLPSNDGQELKDEPPHSDGDPTESPALIEEPDSVDEKVEDIASESPSETVEEQTTDELLITAEVGLEHEAAVETDSHVTKESSEIEEIISEDVPVFETSEPISSARDLQDLFGARPRAQLDDSYRAPLIERGHEIVKKKSSKKADSKRVQKVFVKSLLSVGVFAVLSYLLFVPGKISFTFPDAGLRTSLSSAENSIVIVRANDEYVVGDSVVATIEGEGNPVYFASIAAQSDKEYVLTENNLYHSALRENVKGKVLLVVPGLGFILNKLGL